MEAIPIITRALERVCKEARGSRHEELREACAGTLVRLKEAEAAGLKASADEHFEPFRLAMASQHAGARPKSSVNSYILCLKAWRTWQTWWTLRDLSGKPKPR